jgi:hypothetical protein
VRNVKKAILLSELCALASWPDKYPNPDKSILALGRKEAKYEGAHQLRNLGDWTKLSPL